MQRTHLITTEEVSGNVLSSGVPRQAIQKRHPLGETNRDWLSCSEPEASNHHVADCCICAGDLTDGDAGASPAEEVGMLQRPHGNTLKATREKLFILRSRIFH